MNCDLTEKNTTKLDPYNIDHFVVNAVTDFYDRIETKAFENKAFLPQASFTDASDNCLLFITHGNSKENIKKEEDEPLLDNQRILQLEPQRGNDAVSIATVIESDTLNDDTLTKKGLTSFKRAFLPFCSCTFSLLFTE